MIRRVTQDIRKKAIGIKKVAPQRMPLLMGTGQNISTGIIRNVQYIMMMGEKSTFI